MSINPNGHSLLFAKFVSVGADLVVVENFRWRRSPIMRANQNQNENHDREP